MVFTDCPIKQKGINMSNTSKRTKIITHSAIVIALYIAIMYLTQSFAFGAYQIRVATSLYSLTYLFPFLVIPLGLANSISNILGGMGLVDIIGGCFVGILTGGVIYAIRRLKLPALLIIPSIIAGPGLIVPIWLSTFTGVPYPALALSLCIGQIPPAFLGFFLVKALQKTGMASDAL